MIGWGGVGVSGLDEFVPVGGFCWDEGSGLQELVDAKACPGVDGCIGLLRFGELGRFPIGELLGFADFLSEEYGVDLLQAHVRDLVLLDHLLQFDESSGLYGAVETGNLVEVVGGG